MRQQPATILLLATLATTLAACDTDPKSIGSLEGETGENTTGDGGLCGPSLVDLDFEVLPDGQQELALTCAPELSTTSDGYRIALSNCTDAQAMPADDVTINLRGNWDEPLVEGEPQIELRYVQVSVVINEEVTFQRWLSLRKPGGAPELLLVAVDAISTYPSAFGEYEFDYAPFAIDVVETECPLIENLACAPIQPGALNVWSGEQEFMIPQGQESEFVFDDDTYHVVVEKTYNLVDDCPDDPPGEYEFYIVAAP